MFIGIKKFASNKSGVAAVEFALIAPIFFALIFSIFETGLLLTKIALTDNAVEKVGRTIYTGQAQTNSLITQQTLKEDICDSVVVVTNCIENITLEVMTISGFSSIPTNDAVCRDGSDTGAIAPVVTYNPGASSEISFMRACITTDLLTPFIGVGLSLPKNANGRFQIVSTIAFANEPF